jgi:hypothetical protein
VGITIVCDFLLPGASNKCLIVATFMMEGMNIYVNTNEVNKAEANLK